MSHHHAATTLPRSETPPSHISPPARLTDITAEARQYEAFNGHEQVLQVSHDAVGLSAIIALHDTTLGPALGGCRAVHYASRQAALTDVLRLSRGMTLKSAVAGLDLGGGKAVLLLDQDTELTEPMFRSLGQVIESLRGHYITGEDSGTSVREMDWINRITPHVIGTSARGGDPSRMTALGVMAGIGAAVRHRLGLDTLTGVTVAVQGLGHVGAALCKMLAVAGARLIVADIVPARVEAVVGELNARAVEPEEIHRVHTDIFAPCGLGAALNRSTIPELECSVVAGSANNQLGGPADGAALHRRQILYAPDYVINAGGLISAAMGLRRLDPNGPESRARVEGIGGVLMEIFQRSESSGSSPESIADQMAKERLQGGRVHADIVEGASA